VTTHPAQSPTARDLVTAIVAAGAMTVGWLIVLPHVRSWGGDTLYYLAMAADPTARGHTPESYRMLTPWLAHAIGGPYPGFAIAFRALTASGLTLGLLATYLICRRLGGSHPAALVGLIGLGSLPAWLFNLYQPYLIDGVAMGLTALVVAGLVYGWFAALPVILTAVALSRETFPLLIVPMYMWLRSGLFDLRTAGRVALLIAPGALAFWIARQPLVTTGYRRPLDLFLDGVKEVVALRLSVTPEWWVFWTVAGSFGVWWILAAAGRRHGRALWWIFVLVLFPFLVGKDWVRYALLAFPVVIPCGAIALWDHPRRNLLLVLVAGQCLTVFADLAVHGRLLLGYDGLPSLFISAGLMVAAAAVLLWPRRATSSLTPRAGATA
jgi:hypothetical protein